MEDRLTFPSLSRPVLVAGGERRPMAVVFGAALVCAVPAWFAWSIISAAAAAAILGSGLPMLRALAKRDPLMIEVGMSFFAYRKFYPARTEVPMPKGR